MRGKEVSAKDESAMAWEQNHLHFHLQVGQDSRASFGQGDAAEDHWAAAPCGLPVTQGFSTHCPGCVSASELWHLAPWPSLPIAWSEADLPHRDTMRSTRKNLECAHLCPGELVFAYKHTESWLRRVRQGAHPGHKESFPFYSFWLREGRSQLSPSPGLKSQVCFIRGKKSGRGGGGEGLKKKKSLNKKVGMKFYNEWETWVLLMIQ